MTDVSPHDWRNGPPKSEIEVWHHQRRVELLNVSLDLLRGDRSESFVISDEDIEAQVDQAVRTAKCLIEKTEKAWPRL